MKPIAFSRKNRRGFTLTDVCVVLVALMFLPAVTLIVRRQAFERENRIKCADNLKQIFAAMTTYANMNNGNYPRTYFARVPNTNNPLGPLTDYTGANSVDSFATSGGPSPNDTTASIFLLLKTTGYPPDMLVCPSSDAIPYDPIVCGPLLQRSNFPSRQYFSYSMQNPFPTAGAVVQNWFWNSSALSTGFPLMSDMNPGAPELAALTPQSSMAQMRAGNSPNHDGRGQNVVYGDKSVMWQPSPFCGPPRMNGNGMPTNDNIYTSNTSPPTIGGWPQDALDAVMLPLATAGPQPPARPQALMKVIAGGAMWAVGGAVVVAGIVVLIVLGMRRKRPIPQGYTPGGPPPPLPPFPPQNH